MKKKILVENEKGSFTIEATIVVSTLIFIISLMILSFMLIYHKALIAKTASQVATQTAREWVGGNDGLYYRLLHDSLLAEQNFNGSVEGATNLQKYAQEVEVNIQDEVLNRKFKAAATEAFANLYKSIKKPVRTMVDIKYKNNVFSRQVIVKISQEMRIPFGQLKSFFDGKDTITLEATAVSEVIEPAEYIRNIDLGLEYVSALVEKTNIRSINDLLGIASSN